MIASPRQSGQERAFIPLDWPHEKEHRRYLAEAATQLMDGKSNNTGSVTLTANQATTTLTDARIGPASVIVFMPTTANAAAESLYVTGRGKETATLNHTNNAQSDRTYDYIIVG